MPKTHKTEAALEQEEIHDNVPAEHADGEVSDATGQEEGQEEVRVSEEQRLAEALIKFGYNEVYEDAVKRVPKLTKAERGMLLERVMKPPK